MRIGDVVPMVKICDNECPDSAIRQNSGIYLMENITWVKGRTKDENRFFGKVVSIEEYGITVRNTLTGDSYDIAYKDIEELFYSCEEGY